MQCFSERPLARDSLVSRLNRLFAGCRRLDINMAEKTTRLSREVYGGHQYPVKKHVDNSRMHPA
jgi:hypothetical protein